MNAPKSDRVGADAPSLVEWLFEQAAYYRKHAPDLTRDICAFQDAAALIDSYRAGLELVDPHPAMRAELVRWVSINDALPEGDSIVLLWKDGDDSPWIGYLDGHRWRHADGYHMPRGSVTHWAKMPTGPAVPAAGVVTPSENGPEVAQ